jgi:hypothetical protein
MASASGTFRLRDTFYGKKMVFTYMRVVLTSMRVNITLTSVIYTRRV